MENKRKSARVNANLVVLVKVKNARMARGSRIKNVSETGVCIPLSHYFPVDSLLDLEIRSVDLMNPIKTSARVVRVVNRDNGEFPFEMGVVFLDIPIPNRNMLSDYISRTIAQRGDRDSNWLE
jgi:hypothetical protein